MIQKIRKRLILSIIIVIIVVEIATESIVANEEESGEDDGKRRTRTEKYDDEFSSNNNNSRTSIHAHRQLESDGDNSIAEVSTHFDVAVIGAGVRCATLIKTTKTCN